MFPFNTINGQCMNNVNDFQTELGNLLKKYHAEIYIDLDGDTHGVSSALVFDIKNKEVMRFNGSVSHYDLPTDNVHTLKVFEFRYDVDYGGGVALVAAIDEDSARARMEGQSRGFGRWEYSHQIHGLTYKQKDIVPVVITEFTYAN